MSKTSLVDEYSAKGTGAEEGECGEHATERYGVVRHDGDYGEGGGAVSLLGGLGGVGVAGAVERFWGGEGTAEGGVGILMCRLVGVSVREGMAAAAALGSGTCGAVIGRSAWQRACGKRVREDLSAFNLAARSAPAAPWRTSLTVARRQPCHRLSATLDG